MARSYGRSKSGGIEEDELKALLANEIRAAVNYDERELSGKRSRALEYYRGEMSDTPAMAGRSQVTSRDVADTIGWMLPGIIRVFTASDKMAEYEPVEIEDEAFAGQATDYCNHIFMKDNPGYRILWDATHDALLQGNGVVKHYWDDSEVCEYYEESGITDVQIALLQEEPGVEIVAQKAGEPQKIIDIGPDGQPAEVEIPTFDIKIKRVKMNGMVRVECIEPENFLLDQNARFIEEARFCAHRNELSRSDLIEMGFKKEIVETLPADKRSIFTEEGLSRDGYDTFRDVGHESTRLIEVYECYVKADADGDGIAETIRAFYAGSAGNGELLDWEVWEDDVPFSDIPCEPVPHRWDARSVFDETEDTQRIKTVLTRQLLDNLYASAVPMSEAEVGSVVNPEMLTTRKFGGVIWRKKGSLPIVPHVTQFVADKVLLGLQHFDNVTEKRTGVSRATMALDPEALTNQTATANQNQRDAAYSQIELIARNMAELGWRRVFRQLLKLIVKHQDRPRVIRLRDKWVEMDPRVWNANMDCTINVGLGTGSRDRDMQMLNVMSQGQAMLAEKLAGSGFMDDAIDMLPKITRTMVQIAESAGVRNPDAYYPEFDEQKIAAMKQQAAAMAAQGDPKVAAEKEKAAAQMQIDVQKAQLDAQIEREKMQNDIILKREQMAGELQLKREQLQAELMLKASLSREEMAIKREAGFYKTDKMASTKTSRVNMGGQPG